MKRTILSAVVMMLVGVIALGEDVVDWREAIGNNLANTTTVNWQDRSADRVLAYISKAAGVTITIDEAVVRNLASTQVTVKAADTPLKDILGRVLKTAGLRYTLRDGGLFVSTPERLVQLLLSGERDEEVVEAEPMTEADAIALSSDDVGDDIPDLSNPHEALGFEPWEKPRKAYRDPVTGIMQFPAPPVWVEAEENDDPRFKFQNSPSFLKPEYLWEMVYAKEGGAKLYEHELLGRLARLLKAHPEWTEAEVLKQLLMMSEAAR